MKFTHDNLGDMDGDVPFSSGLLLLASVIEALDSPKKKTANIDHSDGNAWWLNISREKRTLRRQKPRKDNDKPHVDGAPRKQKCGKKRKLESVVSVLLEGNNLVVKKPRKANTIVKRQSNKIDSKLCPRSPPEDVMALIESMGGSNVKLVTRKKIQATDLKANHNRLSIPQSHVVVTDFLSEQEKGIIQSKIIKVPLIDPCLDVIDDLSLRKWDMGNSFIYALCHNWKLVVKKNNLMQGEVVHLWSFRVNGELLFALIREKDHPVVDA